MKEILLLIIIMTISFGLKAQDNKIESTGNVGIGTTNPTEKLQIENGTVKIRSNIETDRFIWSRTDNTMKAGLAGDGARKVFLLANNSTRLTINGNNGNVGIGTTNPDAKLDIYGANGNSNNLILSANYENKYRWRFNTHDRGNAIDLDITASDNNDTQEAVLKLSRSTSGRPEFQLQNNTIVANNGNVGIGTQSPSEKLDVIGTIQSQKLLLKDPNNTSDWNTIWQSGFYQSYNAANVPEANQWFWGINMNHSSNNADYRYNGQIVIKNNSVHPRMYFRSTNKEGTGNWARLVHSVGNQYIEGALGIGTANPDAKLTVKGDIHTQEVKVDLNGAVAPDYVFLEDYDLKSIEEVEAYINDQGHLPNIPSAVEMEKNGIELKQMNLQLLEKIEELTLYTIAQEKELKEAKNKIQGLENNNQELEKRLAKIEALINKK
ncbi:tail fiber protein [uncultured Aquimarina sp.]|uniref:pyocin knob domain-containing protein n=1 Tax=uncultured Aquimarina sp. TaxID=575652 RepID=UPI0026201D5F|nr:tail fiber protein [uncultured Aquimarina sp.]